MNRKVIKIIALVLTILMSFMIVTTNVIAVDDIDLGIFDGQSKDQKTVSSFTTFIATLINIIQVIGMGVAIIMLVYVAIKYISAAPEGKAEFKKTATAYLVGVIVLFAASGILQVVKTFATTNISGK